MPSPDFLQLTEDDSVKWHAMRGMDFAALERMLTRGLPCSYQDTAAGWNMSLSGSPAESFKKSREANSFYFYTMNESSLSLALRVDADFAPHGGYQDEYHTRTDIEPSRILGIAIHDKTARSRLSDMRPDISPNLPRRCLDYQERSVAWVAETFGQTAAEGLAEQLHAYRQKSEDGHELTREENSQMQYLVLETYASHLRGRIGREPTVGDAVNEAIVRTGHTDTVSILPWNAEAKSRIGSQNSLIARAAYARSAYAGTHQSYGSYGGGYGYAGTHQSYAMLRHDYGYGGGYGGHKQGTGRGGR